ncbi:Dynein regulatory complex protein 8 [Rhizoclosmatium sp. JEL0117]|nr:Dynein regulatory complex protein 8 [Rhizoclosmatium sp. JEL0117]
MSNLDPNLVRKIKSAFTVFDQTSNGTCDVREIGTVIRSLGVNPSEEQLRGWVKEMEEEEPTGYIQYDKFFKVTTEKIFSSNAAIRNDEEEIYRAFLALDTEKKGFLLPDDLKRFMMTEGEPFSQEEMDEMLAACTDTSDNRVYYEDFVSLLAANE